MRASDRSALAVVVAVVLATLTVTPLTSDTSFLGVSWVVILLVGGLSAALRRARLGGFAVLGVQALTVLVSSLLLSLRTPLRGEDGVALPWFENYPALWASGVEHMQSQAAPMEPDNGVKLIFVTVIGVIAVMTDLLVLGIARPAWAIAPPATLFLVPALGLGTDTGPLSFLFIAVGYLGILIAEGLNTTARWPRGLSRDSAEGFGTAMPVVWRAAGYLAVPALIGAIVLGVALPTLRLPGGGIGNGPGGNGPLQLTDPTLDLSRNLNQPDDRVVIKYQTTTPGGTYLRLATLPQISSSGWGSVQIRLVNGETLPPVPGLDDEPGERQRTTVHVLDFGSQYLPLPYPPRTFDASGNWRYDPVSLVVVNADDRPDALRGLTYSVESVGVSPTNAELNAVKAGQPSDAQVTATIPKDLPRSITDLSREVTDGADSAAGKAAKIQAYLRSGRFTYSVQQRPGSGYRALEDFLLVDRSGYCEQFAAAMAVMARAVGIPSRVSVGFLPGTRGDDGWEVSIRNMHAWPELYFERYGWVRFEPTPSITGAPPAWTVETQGRPGEEPSLRPSAEPSANEPSQTAAPSAGATGGPTAADEGAGVSWGRTLAGAGIGLLVLVLLAAPATIRVRRRTSRLRGEGEAAEQVEAAWAEIRDTVLDFGGTWPEGSPRTIGQHVGRGLEHGGSESMSQVATLVERSRYARSFEGEGLPERLPRMTDDIRRSLADPVGRRQRVLAFLLPRSLLRRDREDWR